MRGRFLLCLAGLAVGVVLASDALSTGITFEDPNCQSLDASCASERISYDGNKLQVPGYCESGTCSTLGSSVAALQDRVAALEANMTEMRTGVWNMSQVHQANVASLRAADEALVAQNVSTRMDLRALAVQVEAINMNLTATIRAARQDHDNSVADLREHFETLQQAGRGTNVTVAVLEAATRQADRQLNESIVAARVEHDQALAELTALYNGLQQVDTVDQLKLEELNRTTAEADEALRDAISEARAEHDAVLAAVRTNFSALKLTQATISSDVSALRSALTNADERLTQALSNATQQHATDIVALSTVDSLLQIADAQIRGNLSTLAQDMVVADAQLQASIDAGAVQHQADIKALHETDLPTAATYELRANGTCGAEIIASGQECELAAADLGLQLGSAELVSVGPAGCYHESGTLYFSANPSLDAACSMSQQCVCHETPSTAMLAALLPATPTHDAGDTDSYFRTTVGVCDNPITTRAECEHAAQELGLLSTVAQPDGMAWSYDPTGCYYEDGLLKFNEHGNTGLCSISDECICKA